MAAETVDRTPTNVEPRGEVATNVTPTRPSELEDFSYLAPEQADDPAGKTRPMTERATESFTREGTFVGTQGYAPPEHAGTTREGSSTAADVYSLGAILYKLLARKTLFAAANLAETVRKIRECAPESPRASNPQVDAKLEAICMKCLKKDPQERYASAEALADDLERYVRGEPPLAWPLPWRTRAWQTLRPYLAIGATMAITGFAAAAVFFVYYYFDPDRIPRKLESDAREGKLVLIGETGHPRWWRWNMGESAAIITPELHQSFSFTTLEEGRLELLRKAPPEGYRFSAEVRHDQVSQQGWVGVYFAHSQRVTNEGVKNFTWDYTFAEFGLAAELPGPDPKRKYGAASLTPRVRYGNPDQFAVQDEEISTLFLPAQETQTPPVWRRVEIEVTPKFLRLYWEGKLAHELTMAQTRRLGEEFRPGGKIALPEVEFDPSGGLGILASRSKGSFRNVVVEPLR